MTDLKVQLSVQVPNGPTFQSSRTVAVTNEIFNISIPPNKQGTAAAKVDSEPKPIEGLVKLLLIQSNIYPVGEEAGEIKLTIESTKITKIPLHEPVLYLGTKMIEAIGEIGAISFDNTYKLGTARDKRKKAEDDEKKAKAALEVAKAEEKAAKEALEKAQKTAEKAEAAEKLKAATDKVTKAEAEEKAATAAVTKATADAEPEKEIADHTAQLSIVIGREAPAEQETPVRSPLL